eukprot:m.186103 g.186103  ORF g.186103 m.186103 type:complete len:135 (-) comp13612_c2_seq5:6645-7049(-)
MVLFYVTFTFYLLPFFVDGVVQVTYRFLRHLPADHEFFIAPRGHISIKGKGSMKTFLLLGIEGSNELPLLPQEEDEADLRTELIMSMMNPSGFGRRHTGGVANSGNLSSTSLNQDGITGPLAEKLRENFGKTFV